jgi:hypothetical protein
MTLLKRLLAALGSLIVASANAGDVSFHDTSRNDDYGRVRCHHNIYGFGWWRGRRAARKARRVPAIFGFGYWVVTLDSGPEGRHH